MEAKHPDAGELIYEEASRTPRINRKLVMTILVVCLVTVLVLVAIALSSVILAGDVHSMFIGFLLIIVLAIAIAYSILFLSIRPLRLFEKGLTTRRGKFVSYEKLSRVHMTVMRPPYGCQIWLSKSLSRGPMLYFHMGQDEVNARRHFELARRLEGLGLVISAAKHPKAEDDGLVEMTRGALLLEEPPEVFSVWWRRALIVHELLLFSPSLLAIATLAYADLWADGALGRLTNVGGPLVLVLVALFGIVIFFALPRNGWRLYEKALELHSPSRQRLYVHYKDCAYAVLRESRPFRTGALKVFLEGWGIAGDIPVGEKRHAYHDVDRLVELLEGKGVPVER